jgi:hypothetical protein
MKNFDGSAVSSGTEKWARCVETDDWKGEREKSGRDVEKPKAPDPPLPGEPGLPEFYRPRPRPRPPEEPKDERASFRAALLRPRIDAS